MIHGHPHIKDLTHYRSGWLEALSLVETGGPLKHARWLCYCHRCGNFTEVESGHLTSTWRPILSCGCLRTNPINTTLEDLTGQTFGFLYVESLAKKGYKNHHAKWNCICLLCGTHTIVDSADLKHEKTISCGCKKMSKGERAVKAVLDAFEIPHKTQHILYELTTKAGGNPIMDFAIYKNNEIIAFIEYQGKQHYEDCGWFGKTVREETDPMKKEYCKQKNIPLFEVRYDENPTQATQKILETLMLIPCQAGFNKPEGVSTISEESSLQV